MNNYRSNETSNRAYRNLGVPAGRSADIWAPANDVDNPFVDEDERPQARHVATERSEAPGESDMPLAWDAVIHDNSTPYVLLEEGDYSFTVTAVDYGRYPGSEKHSPCGKAMVTMRVDTDDGLATVRRDFFLREKQAWQLSDFFQSIGMMQRGEDFRMDWEGAIGRVGRGHFRPEQYTNAYGETHEKNTVTRFYRQERRSADQQNHE